MILIVIIVSVGWSQITGFLSFKSEKDFKESIVLLYQQMYNLKVLSDEGAFGSVIITIPPGYQIYIDPNNDLIIGQDSFGKEVYRIKTEDINIIHVNGTSGNYFGPGKYDIRIIYSSTPKYLSYSITFK